MEKMFLMLKLWNSIRNTALNLIFGPDDDLEVFKEKIILLMNKSPARETPEEWMSALVTYEDQTVRNLIWLIKYKGLRKAGKLFAPFLWDLILNASDLLFEHELESIILIPVPSHWTKRFRKGFSQSIILADEVAEASRGYATVNNSIIKKIRNTKAQVGLDKHKRLRNLDDAFIAKLKPDTDYTKTLFVIIDDVITTGTTMREVRNVLMKAGARRVIGVAVAH